MLDDEPESYSSARFEEEKREFENHVDGISDAPLDSLLDLYHYPAVKLLRCSAHRYSHGIDLLNAVVCYNDIVALHCACAQYAQQNSIVPLVTLLDDGADVNVCNERGVTAFECFAKCERRNNRINDIVRHFFKYVHRLVVCGLDVHQQNRRQYEVVLARDDMRHFVKEQLTADYDDELSRMEELKVSDETSLRDVLREHTDLLPTLGKIETMIKNESYEAKFPLLWHLVKLRYRQTITRMEWKPMVADALRTLTQRNLRPNCIDAITKELANYDLANLLTVAFNVYLRRYKTARRARRNSNPLSVPLSPRQMLPRI